MATIQLTRTSGSKYLKIYINYTITPDTANCCWKVAASMKAKRTNTGYTTSGTGDFSLSVNGNKKSRTYYYEFTSTEKTIISEFETTIEQTASGSGTCRFVAVADGYSFYFSVDTSVELPVIDVTPPIASAYVSGANGDSATISCTASHEKYNLTEVEYYLDDALQETDTVGAMSYTGTGTVSGLSDGARHTASVVVKSANGQSVAIDLPVVGEYVPITALSVDEVNVTINENKRATYNYTPSDATEIPRYSVANTSIATVDASGFVTGHKIGTTTLTVTCDAVTATAEIKVTRAAYYSPGERTYVRIFDQNERRFGHGGLGTLMPSKCEVSEELNGSYTLSLEHPRDEWGKYQRIIRQAIIECPTPRGYDLFRIYAVDDNDPGKITAKAEHITYDAMDNMISGCKVSNVTGVSAVSSMVGKLNYESFIQLSSDVKAKGSAEWNYINPIKALMDNGDESFTAIFGGEAYRYRNTLTMRERIGLDNAFIIRHRKNISTAKMSVDDSKVVTRLIMTGLDSEGKDITISPVDSDKINNYPHPKIEYKKCSDIKVGAKDPDTEKVLYKDKTAVKTALKNKALSMYADDAVDVATYTLTVNLVAIEDTAEYNDYKALLLIGLGDTGYCILRDGSAVLLRMTKYTYDALTCRYKSVTLGDAKDTIVDYINKIGG